MVTASVETPGPLGTCPLGPLCSFARTWVPYPGRDELLLS